MANLSLFKLVDGLRYAFPKRMAAAAGKHPRVMALHERIAAPRAGGLSRKRPALPYGDGIFRRYPELDGD